MEMGVEDVPPVDSMEPPGLEPEEEEEDIMMEALKGISYIPEKKEIVEEVARRVAKRLLRAKKAQTNLDEALGKKRRQLRRQKTRK